MVFKSVFHYFDPDWSNKIGLGVDANGELWLVELINYHKVYDDNLTLIGYSYEVRPIKPFTKKVNRALVGEKVRVRN